SDGQPGRAATLSLAESIPSGNCPTGATVSPGKDSSTLETENYLLRAEHARGGVGRVLRAEDRRCERVVAVKQLLRTQPEDVRRFLREAKLTARLQHPGIVPVHDIGRWPDGTPFYT